MQVKKPKIKCCIYDFMLSLGLNKSELMIYAFIYSYRKSDVGFYFGKRQFIADGCDVSLRSVERAIPRLKARGLIEEVKLHSLKGLRCCEEFLPKERAGALSLGAVFDKPRKPKYEMVDLGREGYFSVSREQYEALLALVPYETLQGYVRKMEKILEGNILNGRHGPKSFYKTLRKWITEDFSL